jgi:hypothetical protein
VTVENAAHADELQQALDELAKKGPVITMDAGSIVGTDFVCKGSLFLSAGACQISCSARCDNAIARCRSIEGCIAADVNADRTIATLKKAHRWATHGTHRKECFTFSLKVLRNQKRVGEKTRGMWDHKGCVDYTSGDFWGKDLVVDTTQIHCPPKDTKFVIVTYINKPFSGFCALIRSAMLLSVPITILGWRPDEPKRWHQWYLGSKIVSTLYWAEHCDLGDDTTIIFVDSTDVLFQANFADITKV